MRSVPSDIASKLAMKKQTAANGADPSASIWIGRPTTALTTDVFLEKQTVLTATSITDSAVAVCHPRQGAVNTKINIAYIASGVAHVITAATKTKISNHIWIDSGFEVDASAICIAYDGTMPKNDQGKVEFVTESQPYIFWVNGGALYVQKLGLLGVVTLAETNCTDVSAIRAMWSDIGGFDFGLIVFFLLEGTIYYRQLIDGNWTEAETVLFGPSGVTWTEISAFRTWDYRVGVQAKTSDGVVYELFTQFQGIGKTSSDRLEVTDITAEGDITHIDYSNTQTEENIELSNVVGLGDLLSTISAVCLSCINVDDGAGNWGVKIVATFDKRLSSLSSGFFVRDANSNTYAATASVIADSGRTITFTVADFNAAEGQTCEFCYTPGTTVSEATMLAAIEFEFVPTNLDAPVADPPVYKEVWNE